MANHAIVGHQKIETSNFLMIVLILLAVSVTLIDLLSATVRKRFI